MAATCNALSPLPFFTSDEVFGSGNVVFPLELDGVGSKEES